MPVLDLAEFVSAGGYLGERFRLRRTRDEVHHHGQRMDHRHPFLQGSANTGSHVGSLWDAGGDLLGSVTFTNESASGWQEADFATPIAVTAGTTYVASYLAPNGGYAEDDQGLASGVTNGPLQALPSGTNGGNGVYRYTHSVAFPTNTYNSANYWVDVVFTETSPSS